ncbi:MAG: CBS domain-containing protein [Alphaproteobacteria bacterium]|nr:CBS domain-containing protein [Alphaproteobacteria bacterium]
MLVSDILKVKGREIFSVRPCDTAMAAAEKMREEDIGALVVREDDGIVEGTLTERDITRGFARYGRSAHELPAAILMTRKLFSCSLNDSIAAVSKTMTLKRVRHLLVIDADQLVGLVSIGDVIKSRLDEMELETRVLRDIAVAVR